MAFNNPLQQSTRKGERLGIHMNGTNYFLLFDGDCMACSKVARAVGDLHVADLEVKPLRDAGVAEVLAQADLQAPDRPSLLVTGDGEDVSGARLLHGWQMRRVLAGLIGWRRAHAIMRLLVLESEARLAGSGSTRRRIVGVGLAGIAGGVLLPRAASAAPESSRPGSNPGPAASGYRPADSPEVRRALASPSLQRAISTWGPVGPGAVAVPDETQPVLAFAHNNNGRDVITFVDNGVDAERGDPAALSMTGSPANRNAVRFYTVAGVVLGDIAQEADGTARAIAPALTEEPNFDRTCWLICMHGIPLTIACLQACTSCFLVLTPVINCTYCTVCAGPRAITCYKRCP
jgi:predicted DCC family thiol-disulfide oxidoreductase YuxK